MTVKLTKKDRILIYIMAFVLVIFAFLWIAIFPQIDKASALEQKISDLEAEKIPIEAAVMGVDSMKGIYEEARGNYEEILKEYVPYMENHEIDKMMTTMVVDEYGLRMVSLDMSTQAAAEAIPNYLGEADEAQKDYVPILTAHIAITAQGNREKMQKMVDALFTDETSLRVTAYEISGEDANEATLILNCDLYMKNQE